jgi:hypothetical protein
VSYLYRQTIGATAKHIQKAENIFTKKSESTVSTAVGRRTAGGASKLATVAAKLLITATMTEVVTAPYDRDRYRYSDRDRDRYYRYYYYRRY